MRVVDAVVHHADQRMAGADVPGGGIVHLIEEPRLTAVGGAVDQEHGNRVKDSA